MAKATTTIRQALHYQPQHADSFAANHALFNRVVAFYFDVIQAHVLILDLSTKEALTALETLTHATSKTRNGVSVERKLSRKPKPKERRNPSLSAPPFLRAPGTSRFPSMQGSGKIARRRASCSKSGLARAGPG